MKDKWHIWWAAFFMGVNITWGIVVGVRDDDWNTAILFFVIAAWIFNWSMAVSTSNNWRDMYFEQLERRR